MGLFSKIKNIVNSLSDKPTQEEEKRKQEEEKNKLEEKKRRQEEQKKKKEAEEKKREEKRKQYNDKTLMEVIDLLQDVTLSVEDRCLLSDVYLIKLFFSEKSAGGFGFNAEKIVLPFGLITSVYDKGIYGGKGKNGEEIILNYDILFVKNFFKKNNGIKEIPFYNLYKEIINNCINNKEILKQTLLDENCPIYDSWIYENGDDNLVKYKIKTVLFLFCSLENNLEKFNMFKKEHGIPTDKYITIDDLKSFKTQEEIKKFLNSFETGE